MEAWGWNYVLAVRRTGPLRPAGEDGLVTRTAGQLAEAATGWRRLSADDGTKGPRLYDWALVPLVHLTATTGSHALPVRRPLALVAHAVLAVLARPAAALKKGAKPSSP